MDSIHSLTTSSYTVGDHSSAPTNLRFEHSIYFSMYLLTLFLSQLNTTLVSFVFTWIFLRGWKLTWMRSWNYLGQHRGRARAARVCVFISPTVIPYVFWEFVSWACTLSVPYVPWGKPFSSEAQINPSLIERMEPIWQRYSPPHFPTLYVLLQPKNRLKPHPTSPWSPQLTHLYWHGSMCPRHKESPGRYV